MKNNEVLSANGTSNQPLNPNTPSKTSSPTETFNLIADSMLRTKTELTSSASQYTSGEPIILTAKVNSMSYGIEKPSGTVTFLEGSTQIGTGTVNSGQTIPTTSSLSAGPHSIKAQYGNKNFEPSTSSILTLTVLDQKPHPNQTYSENDVTSQKIIPIVTL